jgi:hypothetical protein
MELDLTRFSQNSDQTLGIMAVNDDNGHTLAAFPTLELPWKDNARRISCVPTGRYKVSKRRSPRFGMSFILHDVPDRDFILIHVGNWVDHTKGCILPGTGFQDVNSDGLLDVVSSRKAMNRLLEMMPDEFYINIK